MQQMIATRRPANSDRRPTTTARTKRRRFARLWVRIGYLLAWAELAAAIAHERRTLAGLTDTQLKDVGMNRLDAVRESERPFYDIPKNRLKTDSPDAAKQSALAPVKRRAARRAAGAAS